VQDESVLDRLKPGEAQIVLNRFLPFIRAPHRSGQIAQSLLSEVAFDLWLRSGRRSGSPRSGRSGKPSREP